MLSSESVSAKIVVILLGLALALPGVGVSWADSHNKNTNNGHNNNGSEVRLRAKFESFANGVFQELNGDFRKEPGKEEFKASFEASNLMAGDQIQFCLVQGAVTPNIVDLGVATVEQEIPGLFEAAVEFDMAGIGGLKLTGNVVSEGDVLQARRAPSACSNQGATSLATATFMAKH